MSVAVERLPRVSTVFDLEVYKRAYKISITLHKVTLDFPKFEQYGGLGDQMRRASRSVCANLAEGWGKLTSENERRQFIRTAHGSAVEMQVWLDYCRDVDYVDGAMVQAFRQEYMEIGAMLRGLMAK